jgi:uncharacterized protein (TIGR02118 family)
MAQLLVMYKTPKDAAAFDKHYYEQHVQIANDTGPEKIWSQSRSRSDTE